MSEQKLSRPPFDEQGYSHNTAVKKETKKKKWALPVIGLAVLFLVGGILLARKLSQHTPEELCMYAIADAFAQSFGYEAPLMKELPVKQAVSYLQSGEFELGVRASYKDCSKQLAGTAFGDQLEAMGMPTNLKVYSGISLGVQVNVSEDAANAALQVGYGALSFGIANIYLTKQETVCSMPLLTQKILSAEHTALLAGWQDAEAWKLLDPVLAGQIQSVIRRAVVLLQSGMQDANAAKTWIYACYDTTGEFLQELLDCFSYEELTDADGKTITKKFPIDGKMVTCTGYCITADMEALQELLMRVSGDHTGLLRMMEENTKPLTAELYLTKKADLVSFSMEYNFVAAQETYPIAIQADFSGEEDPQHALNLVISVGGSRPYSLTLEKTETCRKKGVRSEWKADLNGLDRPYGVRVVFDYDGEDRIALEANTYMSESTIGALTGEIQIVREDDGCQFQFYDMQFSDTYSGTELLMEFQASVYAAEEPPKRPQGTELAFLSMSREDCEALVQEIEKKLKKYLNMLF